MFGFTIGLLRIDFDMFDWSRVELILLEALKCNFFLCWLLLIVELFV